MAVRDFFLLNGWRVVTEEIASGLAHGPFDLIYTDSVELLPGLSDTLHPDPDRAVDGEARIVALVDDLDEKIEFAWASGVEWVVRRPLVPDDPFGVRDFLMI